jgi:hypothetical protein
LKDGKIYINVHSLSAPAGLIRGNLHPAKQEGEEKAEEKEEAKPEEEEEKEEEKAEPEEKEEDKEKEDKVMISCWCSYALQLWHDRSCQSCGWGECVLL